MHLLTDFTISLYPLATPKNFSKVIIVLKKKTLINCLKNNNDTLKAN